MGPKGQIVTRLSASPLYKRERPGNLLNWSASGPTATRNSNKSEDFFLQLKFYRYRYRLRLIYY